MKSLFEPIKISQLSLKNRIIRSATFEYAGGTDGHLTQEVFELYENLAKGGVGAIITGMVAINEKSRLLPSMIKAYDELFIPGYRKLSNLSHSYDCKLIAQISHCGVKATCIDRGGSPVGPSERTVADGITAEALTKEEIKEIIKDFAKTAVACKDAGMDGIQIHGAHGYLLSQFLSPTFNKRGDEYGGSIENRARLVFEVYQAIREAVGKDYPVWIKINSEDFTEDGMTAPESLWVCQELSRLGIDAIEISGGVGISKESKPSQLVKTEEDEGTFVKNIIKTAGKINTPVLCVGGFKTPKIMEQALNHTGIEAISLSRPLICEPELVNRWQSGNLEKARCISCNQCFNPKGKFGCKAFA